MRLPRRIIPYGPDALLLEWEQRIDPEINAGVHAYAVAMWNQAAVLESIPAYCSLVVRFNPTTISFYQLSEWIYDLKPTPKSTKAKGKLHKLPVIYGGENGPDFDSVAGQLSLSPEKLIDLHTSVTYRVYQLGYQPGFAFLGQTDAALEIGRKENPRAKVPAGSVGLAGRQTAVYPHQTPGGWQLIGRCPANLWDGTKKSPNRLQPGDRVKFYAITSNDWEANAKKMSTWKV